MSKKFKIFAKVGSIVVVLIIAKTVAHLTDMEFLSVNPLFSGIVAGNVFLIGFLLSGVLSDYKESEKLPGELAASIENLAQEVYAIKVYKKEADITSTISLITHLNVDLHDWFYKKIRTAVLLQHLNDLTEKIAVLEKWAQATIVARLKQEQSNLRRTIIRIHTIRETNFISAGYLIADAITVLLCIGLVLSKINPFYESLFFVGVISFLLIYLLLLIRDLDNPFGYFEESSSEDVSLHPIVNLKERLSELEKAVVGLETNRVSTGDPSPD